VIHTSTLELAERDASGTLIAKARAIVWSRDVERVLGTFQQATGVRVAAGIKVLVRARPEFSAQYGLTLHIDAIDPSYTLGDLEAKKRQIREQLKTEGIFERNRQLPAPWDYRFLLVVSPPRAAGLGDFARDADRLQAPWPLPGRLRAQPIRGRRRRGIDPRSDRSVTDGLVERGSARCDRHHPRRRRSQRPRLAQ
jgi:hypothetical protein